MWIYQGTENSKFRLSIGRSPSLIVLFARMVFSAAAAAKSKHEAEQYKMKMVFAVQRLGAVVHLMSTGPFLLWLDNLFIVE